jgi:hypothetical protein
MVTKRRERLSQNYEDNVFINCPFDWDYQPLFRALVFTIHDSGFIAHCALETANAADSRLDRIMSIIRDCKYGVHDLCRIEIGNSGLPHFNMPLELGLFLGCREYGSKPHSSKVCLVLDKEKYRYQEFISDIAGQDISSHGGEIGNAIVCVRDWLRTNSGRSNIPGAGFIQNRYAQFEAELPSICDLLRVDYNLDKMQFADFSNLVVTWLENHPLPR